MNTVNREFLLSFWKLHILHHAGEEPVHGMGILTELRRHGYDISPGTLYPLLRRLERLGWLRGKTAAAGGRRARRDYRLTPRGAKLLASLKPLIVELYEEVAEPRPGRTGSHAR